MEILYLIITVLILVFIVSALFNVLIYFLPFILVAILGLYLYNKYKGFKKKKDFESLEQPYQEENDDAYTQDQTDESDMGVIDADFTEKDE